MIIILSNSKTNYKTGNIANMGKKQNFNKNGKETNVG